MNLIYVTLFVFAVAAALGLTILNGWYSKKRVSRTVIYSHGAFAALGLLLIIIFAVQHPGNYPKIALILFIAAALGGFYMFLRDLKQKMTPFSIAIAHALLALSGFVALLLFAF